jgi:uncharacterized protein
MILLTAVFDHPGRRLMQNVSPGHADHRPLPFRQFIVKLHGRCNLACDYCYVYTMADQRWRSRPRAMSPQIVNHTVARVAEHARAHRLDEVELIIHGGEPLLAGVDAIGHLVRAMRSTVPAQVLATVQTNATLLNREFLELFRQLNIRVGVSLDGAAAANDRHRVRRDGAGTYHAVRRALLALGSAEYEGLFAGLLCTVDLANDPVGTYEALLEFMPPIVDFLLPHGNWTSPPPGLPGASPYADWLIAVFDRWYSAPRKETRVRFFEEVINVVLGGQSRVEGVGLSPVAMIVVETDGMIEQADVLASAYDGAAATGLHVARDSFDAALRLPDVLTRQAGLAGLPAACHGCDQRAVCGGGLSAHRFRADAGFDNPSVYCSDLYRLISHVRTRLSRDLLVLRQGVG